MFIGPLATKLSEKCTKILFSYRKINLKMQSVKRVSFLSQPQYVAILCQGGPCPFWPQFGFVRMQLVMFEETAICCSPTSLQMVSPRTLSWKLPKWPYVTWPWLDLVRPCQPEGPGRTVSVWHVDIGQHHKDKASSIVWRFCVTHTCSQQHLAE